MKKKKKSRYNISVQTRRELFIECTTRNTIISTISRGQNIGAIDLKSYRPPFVVHTPGNYYNANFKKKKKQQYI